MICSSRLADDIVMLTGMGGLVVDTPAQPKASNMVTATPASRTQNASKSNGLRFQRRLSVFMKSEHGIV